jgi:hypothetical protein
MQAALEAAGLSVDPPLTEAIDTVSLRVDRRRAALAPSKPSGRAGAASKPAPSSSSSASSSPDEPAPRPSGVAAYAAAAGLGAGARRRRAERAADRPADDVPLADVQRTAAAEQADLRTPQSIAALMPALIVPVLAASFLGPLFGAIFAGLALLTSATLSRPGALADGKLGPLRMPASLARSFLLVSSGVAIGALGMSLALIAAGGGDTATHDPNAPIEQPSTTQPKTPAPAAPSAAEKQAEADRKAAAERKARAERRQARERTAERKRRAARARARRAQQQQQQQQQQQPSVPPSGGGGAATP